MDISIITVRDLTRGDIFICDDVVYITSSVFPRAALAYQLGTCAKFQPSTDVAVNMIYHIDGLVDGNDVRLFCKFLPKDSRADDFAMACRQLREFESLWFIPGGCQPTENFLIEALGRALTFVHASDRHDLVFHELLPICPLCSGSLDDSTAHYICDHGIFYCYNRRTHIWFGNCCFLCHNSFEDKGDHGITSDEECYVCPSRGPADITLGFRDVKKLFKCRRCYNTLEHFHTRVEIGTGYILCPNGGNSGYHVAPRKRFCTDQLLELEQNFNREHGKSCCFGKY